MTTHSHHWQSFGGDFNRLSKKIAEVSTVNVNSAALRHEAESVAMAYFQEVRPILDGAVKPEYVEILDESFEAVLTLTHGANKKLSYEKYLKRIKKVVPKITGQLAQYRGPGQANQTTSEDEAIIGTLNDLVPSASLSYRQALADLGVCPSIRWSSWSESDSLRGYEQGFSPLED